MKAIILAAGRGGRMKNLTDERPKCLIKLGGKTLLEWQLSALRKAGITEIAIVTGYRREMLTGLGLSEFYNPRWLDTNMTSSLACAEQWLLNEPCIVSYSDIFYDAKAILSLMKCAAPLAITYDPNWLELWAKRFDDPLSDAETFRLKPDGNLAEIGGKPRSPKEIEGQYMGLLRFTPGGWHEVKLILSELSASECDRIDITKTLQKVIAASRIPIAALAYQELWGEVDSAFDLLICEQRLKPALAN